MPTLKTINGVEPLPKPVKLADEAIFIGRAKVCKIALMDKLASRKHVKIFKIDEAYYAEDLKSRNGTYLNGQKLEGIKKIQSGDVIKVGEHEIVFDTSAPKAPTLTKANAPTAVKANPDEIFMPSNDVPFGAPGTVYCLNFTGDAGAFSKVLLKPVTTVGRGDEADIHIDEMLASRLHCQFEIKAGGLKLVDLESRNGTKVRGEFVNQQYLDRDDEIIIGNTKIHVTSRLPLTTGEYQELKIEEALEKNMDIDQLLTTGDMRKSERAESAVSESNQVVPLLQYQLEDGSGRSFALHKTEVTIGRSDEATLTISDKLSSRVHAKISRDDDRYFVEDLSSRNGTKINKREVQGKIELLPGDVIQVGEIEFTFVLPDISQIDSLGSATGIAQTIADVSPAVRKRRRRSRDQRLRKSASESGDYTGLIIVGVIIFVVLILALLLVLNNQGGTPEFPNEPDDSSIAKTKKNKGNGYRPYVGNNGGTVDFDDDDDESSVKKTNSEESKKEEPKKELTEDEKDDMWIEKAANDFEFRARRDVINTKRKVVDDLLLGEHYGAAYVLVNEKVKEYQNKDLDAVLKVLNDLLVRIDNEAHKLWESYIKNAIKNTPEEERLEKFKNDIIDWFEGYDKYYEPAMQMIGN